MVSTERLKDGTEVRIRPVDREDAERIYWFLGGLTEEDRRYLRVDVRNRNLVLERFTRDAERGAVRIVAEIEGEIVGEAALAVDPAGWAADVGEIRLLTAPAWRRRGLGMTLGRAIYQQAVDRKLRKIIARMMRPQTSARRIFHRLGFRDEAVLPDLLRDLEGQTQDLVVMSADLDDMNRELRHFFESTDWRSHR